MLAKTLCPEANKCPIVCLSQALRSIYVNVSNIIFQAQPSILSEVLATVLPTANANQPTITKQATEDNTGPIDDLTRQISDQTMGQQFKVYERQKSFCLDKPSMLNADGLI